MKKWICLLLILSLAASIMIGCGDTKPEAGTQGTASTAPTSGTTQSTAPTTQSTAPTVPPVEQLLPASQPRVNIWDLTEEERARMGAAEKYYFWGDSVWAWLVECYVYAQFGEVYVMQELKGAADQAVTRDFVDGLLFIYSTSIRLNVLSGDRFYSLPEAYELGILTNEQLVQVHINLYTHHPNRAAILRICNLPDALETELCAFVQEIYTPTQEEMENWEETYPVGNFGYVYVLYEPISGEPGLETVEGMEFVYPDGTRLFVYYNGAGYSLQEAVDQGILRAEHLQLVLENHNRNIKS